jgi:hypothetical protein
MTEPEAERCILDLYQKMLQLSELLDRMAEQQLHLVNLLAKPKAATNNPNYYAPLNDSEIAEELEKARQQQEQRAGIHMVPEKDDEDIPF